MCSSFGSQSPWPSYSVCRVLYDVVEASLLRKLKTEGSLESFMPVLLVLLCTLCINIQSNKHTLEVLVIVGRYWQNFKR